MSGAGPPQDAKAPSSGSAAAGAASVAATSLRTFLLVGILLPVILVIGINSFSLYSQALAAELRARLFQPFSAGDAGSNSGLGLAICQEIVLALGGSITLDNRENHGRIAGLHATVRLPLAHNGS